MAAAAGPGVAAVPVLVLTAAALHAVWNALAHGMKDQLAGFALIDVAFTGIAAVMVGFAPFPNAAAWPFILTSSVLQVGYQLLLLRAYRLGDFAQMYPLARGTSPLVVAGWTILVLGRPTTPEQLAGVLVISLGLIALALSNGLPTRQQWPAVAAALCTGITIASYTITDGTGVRRSDTVFGYIAWGFLVQGPLFVLSAHLLRGRRLLSGLPPRVWVRGLTGGALSLTAYGLVVWAQSRGNLATIAALRETSIVMAAVIGAVFLHERFGRWRLAASAVVVLGIALLELSHA